MTIHAGNLKPTLTIQRRFKAPARLVYMAWTNPEHMLRWWATKDAKTIRAEADLRVGGGFRVAFTTPDGATHDVSGEYLEIVPEKRLVFTWAWITTPERESQVTVTFKDEGEKTLLTLHHEKFFDQTARDNHETGWTEALDNLEKMFAEKRKPLMARTSTLSPKYEMRGPLLLAGLSKRYGSVEPEEFAAQWKRFIPFIGKTPGQVGETTYGVVVPEGPTSFSYLTAVEVSDASGLPKGLTPLRIDAPRYAIFRHNGNVSTIHETMNAIYEEFMPTVATKRVPAASFVERYGPSFDPKTGGGGFDILVPLKA